MGFFLGMLQMLLYGIFRNKKEIEIEEKKGDEENVINIKVVGTPHQPTHQEEDQNTAAAAAVPCAICVEPTHINMQLESPLPLVV